MSLAFCMGADLEGILGSPIGQPMAQIFLNSFGQNGTLALWSFVVLVQYVFPMSYPLNDINNPLNRYMMGSSMVMKSLFIIVAFFLTRLNSFLPPPVNRSPLPVMALFHSPAGSTALIHTQRPPSTPSGS